MKVKDFYFDLPQELIAQVPLEKRDESKLMVVNKINGEIEHKKFKEIIDYLEAGDTLVLNDTRVMPARLHGIKEETGAKMEFLLLRRLEKDVWETLVKPGKRAKLGSRFVFGNGELKAEVIEVLDNGNRKVRFEYSGIFEEVLDILGEMPLPPYITEKLEDKERYQTVYSKEVGSAAAPTAGLHFTEELLEKIKNKGINIVFVTLHVGLGTFRPVKAENIEDHEMHSEYYYISKETADIINATKEAGKRVIAVGTTSNRTLESVSDENGRVKEASGYTDIFIYPGYKFKIVDALITNFHLPESTLIMLISAFSNKDIVMNAYKIAVENRYRFFSFGDAMFLK
ncbi:MAG: tRNA preQ1(34) S-adenosylmethionine ribosyltransferase-isomerase QueA [Clostridium argentinense]|uniref:S-adenosylmethionine:tRNA ribosyltransferase-isomerase n=1 Tax=Clostridium faecium TaxID=2762223 RepID=A0ABR8YWK0_9CLOT|nr:MULTISPECIES: tRNA preQ1(34) S-adenosylmethionine ribosyltransferase-isomerase QueA [Clostridium]MBD8048615.1 tRNA preQ1(34) S-adenosylmethionine ribosyltransferase-isomerase QueA [Clostridium faecium]MBS5822646.1 tRNA preQ1(34) S-adenosylmethionine ribosyltransferase-isomerase QueA [Clostridium argentinense]MDU1347789.1 tRNA preQ1(34) S-adenosylmethionine ribosyltransferase-isomerase QueA [Clostridium argentinense]